jgi:hypothetical protein
MPCEENLDLLCTDCDDVAVDVSDEVDVYCGYEILPEFTCNETILYEDQSFSDRSTPLEHVARSNDTACVVNNVSAHARVCTGSEKVTKFRTGLSHVVTTSASHSQKSSNTLFPNWE